MSSSNGYVCRANKNDARPPLAVLNYTLHKACLSYQGKHCSSTDLCQPMTATSELTQQPPIRKRVYLKEILCTLVLRLKGPIQ